MRDRQMVTQLANDHTVDAERVMQAIASGSHQQEEAHA